MGKDGQKIGKFGQMSAAPCLLSSSPTIARPTSFTYICNFIHPSPFGDGPLCFPPRHPLAAGTLVTSLTSASPCGDDFREHTIRGFNRHNKNPNLTPCQRGVQYTSWEHCDHAANTLDDSFWERLYTGCGAAARSGGRRRPATPRRRPHAYTSGAAGRRLYRRSPPGSRGGKSGRGGG